EARGAVREAIRPLLPCGARILYPSLMRKFRAWPSTQGVLFSILLVASSAGAEPWTAPIFRAPRGSKPPTAAAPLPADVETAAQPYAKLEFDDANKVAERVVKLRGLTHDQLVRAYKVLAITHGFLDREDQARDAFVLLLTYDPEFSLDQNLGPKVS